MKIKSFRLLFLSALIVLFTLHCPAIRGNDVSRYIPLSQIECQDLVPQKDTASILIVGDVMLHWLQLRTALKYGADSLLPESYNFTDYYRYIQNIIDKADFRIANMEFPVGITPFSGYPVFSSPESIIEESINSGFNLFLLANNHIGDKGLSGLTSTYNAYQKYNAAITGFYENEEDELENNPYITDINGIKVAFINFTYGTNGFKIHSPYIVNMMEETDVKRAITRAKERGADIIIALPHWGVEYDLNESAEQKRWAKLMTDEGVRIIVGSHPHVIQPIYIERESEDDSISTLTAYSLGNYISNMSIQNSQLGIALVVKIAKDHSSGTIEILEPDVHYLWCARGGKLIDNYTVIPIVEYLDKEDLFRDKNEYVKMKNTYTRLIKNRKQIR